ncbi:RagB/SusD family nutrient uptake outer membrane protein [Lutibacter sp. A80]|uniref:RagB/SusD family nutrient uptake outer membrane protein n=1 Tax=Lutibacter sp. A80 TaxID=2918453 RepID=UPI001F054171|nr:RagB/SusD family nutrient uptake outer membrane protein [Lutibacter sp. A80]UMB61588.1 RagB/SusD family nutrient uptake outer membrane protein [Lutibacter sp. A80]
MKNIIYLYKSLFCILLLLLTSCQLTEDLDEYEPLYSLPGETAISNQTSAELALTGMYATLRQTSLGGFPHYTIVPSTLSGIDTGGLFSYGVEDKGFQSNNPDPTGTKTRAIYTNLYTLINRANWVIEGTEKLVSSDFVNPDRQLEIIGEAKAMRATGHFYLLRLYGQFYDLSSEYGVVLNLVPAKDANPKPRNTVAETYTAILDDLEDAIVEAPNVTNKYYASSVYAKGLKAKVLLYKGDYSQAALVAEDVINNSGSNFGLMTTFGELFQHEGANDYLNTVESLFNTYSDLDEGIGSGNFWDGIFANTSDAFYELGENGTMTINGQVIKHDATRIPYMQLGTPFSSSFNGNFKYKQRQGINLYETHYHLRMAEIYLIYAEAEARRNTVVTTEALNALNAIRLRAGATTTGADGFETYPISISYPEFLEAVRIEKLMELATEMGEDFYDMVRYEILATPTPSGESFKASMVNATATNQDKFIIPIPETSIIAGQGVVKQNPSY